MYNTVRIFEVQELLKKEKDLRVLISSAASSYWLEYSLILFSATLPSVQHSLQIG